MLFEIVAILLAIVIAAAILLNRNTTHGEAKRAEEYRKAAALRGWQLEFDGVEYRYSGTTEGVPWRIRVGHRGGRGFGGFGGSGGGLRGCWVLR